MDEKDLWTPSDELMRTDPIAEAKIAHPYTPTTLSEAGVVLPDDHLDDDALEAAAAATLAELADGDAADEEYALQPDDEALDAPDDPTPGDDV